MAERRKRDEDAAILLLIILALIACARRAGAKPQPKLLSGFDRVTILQHDSSSATAPIVHSGGDTTLISYADESLSQTQHDGFEQVLINYYDAAPQLHEDVDTTGIDYYDYSEACVTPSGIDPYEYKPRDGWWRFYHFVRVEELYDPEWDVFGDIGYIRVQDSILTVRGRSGGTGFVMFNTTRHVPSVIATAFRIRDVTGDLPRSWLEYYVEDGSQITVFALSEGTLNPDSTVTTHILDRNTGQFITGDITIRQGDWYLFLYDYDSNTVKLVDASGNVIAEATPSRSATDRTYFYVYFSVSGGNHTFDCDWLGIG
jgi:hypothetical protein